MESERQTRKKRIDPLLKGLGWKIVAFDEARPLTDLSNCAIEEYPTENGPADYALCVNGQIIGVVEAKKLTLGPQNVLTQAQRYSRGFSVSRLNFDGFRVPFLYSTNGEVIWFHDVRHTLSRSRKIRHFHTPAHCAKCWSGTFKRAATGFKTIRMSILVFGRIRLKPIMRLRKLSAIGSASCSSRWLLVQVRPSRLSIKSID